MKKKIMKAIRDLNAYIDNDRQKLCDELHELKLSHKRMEKLCRESLVYIKTLENYVIAGNIHVKDISCNVSLFSSMFSLRDRIEQELSYPYYRVNWKVKGGKDA